MTIPQILVQGDPALEQICRTVEWPDADLENEILQLHSALSQFRKEKGFGRAIAAPQIGVKKRFIAVNLGATPFVVINPEITWKSENTFEVWDDCLSVPNWVVKVRRHCSISIRYQDEKGRIRQWNELPEELSELLQHEIDHLDGVLMTERALDKANIRPISEHEKLVGGMRKAHRLSLDSITKATDTIAPEFLNSAQYHNDALSKQLGCDLWLKVETANPIRSFKGRGADYFLKALVKRGDDRQLVCASAGNFGQAMAYSCSQLGRPLIVYASKHANPLKLQRMRELGADVRLAGEDFDAAKAVAKDYCEQNNGFMVEDGKEAEISEGAGTIGVELLNNVEALDAIVIPLGNGALLNGIARWVKAASPCTQIIGVCSRHADAMAVSWQQNTFIQRDSAHTNADGIAVRVPVPEALEDMKGLVDDVVLVEEEQIVVAIKQLAEHAGLIVEPAGAVGIAAIASNAERFQGKRVATILCGSNVTPEQLSDWLT